MSLIALVIVAIGLVCAMASRRWPLSALDRTTVARFAAAHDLALTPESGRYVVSYLVRSLRWRRWGGFIGFGAAIAQKQLKIILSAYNAKLFC